MVQKSIRWAFNFMNWKPTQKEWMLASQCIQNEEKERIGMFVYKKDAKSAMVGRLLIRKYICESLDIPYPLIHLERTDKGRPVLQRYTGPEVFDFNISHQGDYCVLAAEPQATIGVDIMKFQSIGDKDLKRYFHLMKRQFTSSEWDYIKTPNEELAQKNRFLRLWCLKESYLKATGQGITEINDELSFKCETKDLASGVWAVDSKLLINNQKTDWLFQETIIDSSHCIAVALKKPCPPTDFAFLNFSELTSCAKPRLKPDLEYFSQFDKKEETV